MTTLIHHTNRLAIAIRTRLADARTRADAEAETCEIVEKVIIVAAAAVIAIAAMAAISAAVNIKIDAAVMAEQVAKLPRLRSRDATLALPINRVPSRPTSPLQTALNFEVPVEEPPAERPDSNRVAGSCERCGKWHDLGGGKTLRYGRRDVVVCDPGCR